MIRLTLFTALSLLAFAANSLLARAALDSSDMGAAEFTLIRLICGAAMLALLILSRKQSPEKQNLRKQGSWTGAAMLALYAGAFSFAYLMLETGIGALALFAAVQITMMGYAALTRGLSVTESLGAIIAIYGFIFLIAPSLGSDSFSGFMLMSLAGIGWGVYTILGKTSQNPLALNAGNFWRAALLSLPLLIFILPSPNLSMDGVILAASSGAITSGIGYAIWYAALPRLSTSLAATLQLSVPPIAAIIGWMFLSEELTQRLLLATLIISVGIAIVIYAQKQSS